MVWCMSIKAQALSFDFLIASSIFLLAVGVIYIYWVYSNIQIEETQRITDMIDRTYLASQFWFREGTPPFWDSTNIIDLGLQNNHRFNRTKMNIMDTNLGYEETKSLIGLGGYEYSFTIYNSTNDTVFNFGQIPNNPENLVKIKRVGILDGSLVNLEIMVWG